MKKETSNKKEFAVNVWLREDLYEKIKTKAEKLDTSMSNLIRSAIRRFLDE